MDEILERLRGRMIPDDCVVWFCDCRDTGYVEEPDPQGREGAVLVRRCPKCGDLSRKERQARWQKADEETARNARAWRKR